MFAALAALLPDLAPDNAWRVDLDARDRLRWFGAGEVLYDEPAASFALRLESWRFGLIPIENEI